MFWFGLIVGFIIGVIALMVVSLILCSIEYGSMEAFHEGTQLVKVATDNRVSEMYVVHNGEVLDMVRFEELE